MMDSTADLSPQASLSLADSLYVDEEFELAVDAYAASLSLIGDNPTIKNDNAYLRIRIHSHRSAAFYKLGRYVEAREDAYAAISCPPSDGLRAGEMEVVYKRLGLACLELQAYEEAKTAMEQAKQLATLNGRETTCYEVSIRKCNNLLESKTPGAAEPDTLSTSESFSPPSHSAQPSPAPAPAPGTAAVPLVVNQRPVMPKYQYYQNDKFMTIAILESGVSEEDLQVTFAPRKLTVVLRKAGVSFTVLHGALYEKVDVGRCKVKIMEEKVLVKLRKVEAHEWQELMSKGGIDDDDDEEKEEQDAKVQDMMEDEDVPMVDATKTRPYASHRDWDAIGRNIELQEKKEVPEGEEAMNKLFQDIYGKADEDTKRAMIKSYQTSGGTVLSTNWDEVAKTDYEKERTAPKGMEWKTWEGDKLKQKEDED